MSLVSIQSMIFDDNNTIKSIANDDRFNTIDMLKWYGLVHAIPKQWRDIICIKGLRKPGVFEHGMRLSNDFVSISNITSKHLYSEYMNKMNIEPLSQNYLKRAFGIGPMINVVIYLFYHLR